jgi:hypothetical protein
MPFNLTSKDETEIVNYITETQSNGLGLNVADVRNLFFTLRRKIGETKIYQKYNRFCVF